MAKCLASSDQTFGISMATLLANALDLLLAIIGGISLGYTIGTGHHEGAVITLECDWVRASEQQRCKRGSGPKVPMNMPPEGHVVR